MTCKADQILNDMNLSTTQVQRLHDKLRRGFATTDHAGRDVLVECMTDHVTFRGSGHDVMTRETAVAMARWIIAMLSDDAYRLPVTLADVQSYGSCNIHNDWKLLCCHKNLVVSVAGQWFWKEGTRQSNDANHDYESALRSTVRDVYGDETLENESCN